MYRKVVQATLVMTLIGALTAMVCEAYAQNPNKKVRIKNDTTDADIRVKCLGFGNGVGFVADVKQGKQHTEQGVLSGHRGIIVWENFNNKIIAMGQFDLPAMGNNAIITITGNSSNGYSIGLSDEVF